MEIVLTVLEIIAPAFLLAAVGFTWVALGVRWSPKLGGAHAKASIAATALDPPTGVTSP